MKRFCRSERGIIYFLPFVVCVVLFIAARHAGAEEVTINGTILQQISVPTPSVTTYGYHFVNADDLVQAAFDRTFCLLGCRTSGVYGSVPSNIGAGVRGEGFVDGNGVEGSSASGYGGWFASNTGTGLYAMTISGPNAGYFQGNVYATGSITPGSSRELKEDIHNLTVEEALNAFVKLVPVTYRYKADKEQVHVGFIAEDMPDLLATKNRKGVSPLDVAATLTKVVQIQNKKIDELSKTLQEKNLELQSLKNAMQEIMSRVAIIESSGKTVVQDNLL